MKNLTKESSKCHTHHLIYTASKKALKVILGRSLEGIRLDTFLKRDTDASHVNTSKRKATVELVSIRNPEVDSRESRHRSNSCHHNDAFFLEREKERYTERTRKLQEKILTQQKKCEDLKAEVAPFSC